MLKGGKSKRSQVTVFIIIAVIIIGAVVTAFAFRNKINLPGTGSSNVNSEVKQIDYAIEDCAKQRAIDAIRIVGLQGGYVNLPDNYLTTDLSNVAYGYYNGKNTLASKSTIEKEINYYVGLTMPFCIESEFNGFNLTKSKPEVTTKINPNSVSVSLKMPISALRANQAFTIDREYRTEIPIKLGNMIDVANAIVKKESENSDSIPVGYLTELTYDVLILYEDNENVVYAIVDLSESSRINSLGYSFLFANKLGVKNETA